MKNTIIFLILFIVQNVFGQIYNVTFQANMSNESSISSLMALYPSLLMVSSVGPAPLVKLDGVYDIGDHLDL